MNTRFILNTRGRTDDQLTLRLLAPSVRKLITIVCWPGERRALQRAWGEDVGSIVEHPDHFDYLSQIRHWCLETFTTEHVVFMDDNLDFHARIPGDFPEHDNKFLLNGLIPKHYKPETIERIQQEMFTWVSSTLDTEKYGIVGISTRTGNHTSDTNCKLNRRFYAFWGVCRGVYTRVQPHLYKDCYVKEDFCIGLEMAVAGYPNIISFKYAFDKPRGANARGGCSTYRTVQLHNDSVNMLKENFPAFVRDRVKSIRNWGGDFEGDKLPDITIQWQKAYKYGVNKTMYRGFF